MSKYSQVETERPRLRRLPFGIYVFSGSIAFSCTALFVYILRTRMHGVQRPDPLQLLKTCNWTTILNTNYWQSQIDNRDAIRKSAPLRVCYAADDWVFFRQSMGKVYGYPYYGADIEGVSFIHEGCVAILPCWRIKYNATTSNGSQINCVEYIQLHDLARLVISPTNLDFSAILRICLKTIFFI